MCRYMQDYKRISNKWKKIYILHKLEIGSSRSGKSTYIFRNICVDSCLNMQMSHFRCFHWAKTWQNILIHSYTSVSCHLSTSETSYDKINARKMLRISVSISKASSFPLLPTTAWYSCPHHFHNYRTCFALGKWFVYLFIIQTVM
jgi:hypothetical protein